MPKYPFLFYIHKSVGFSKVNTFEMVLMSYFFTLYDIIIFQGDPTTPPKTPPTPESEGLLSPTPRIDDPVSSFSGRTIPRLAMIMISLHRITVLPCFSKHSDDIS